MSILRKALLLPVLFLIILGALFATDCDGKSRRIFRLPISTCRTLQMKTGMFLARIETGSNKITVFPQNNNGFENSYTSEEYKYTITYPSTWTLDKYVVEEHETISLTKDGAVITIGLPEESVCANMGCDYNAGTIYTPFGEVVLTKAFVYDQGFLNFPVRTEPLYYGFYSNFNHTRRVELPYILSTFATESGGQEVADIIYTVKVL